MEPQASGLTSLASESSSIPTWLDGGEGYMQSPQAHVWYDVKTL